MLAHHLGVPPALDLSLARLLLAFLQRPSGKFPNASGIWLVIE
jgi:hypothetical protein